MEASRLRLPFSLPRLPFDGLASGNGLTIFYVIFTIVMFAVFLLVNFPYEQVVRQLLQNVNSGTLQVDVDGARFAWWRGIEINHVTVTDPRKPDAKALFETRALYLNPTWGRLLRGDLASFSFSSPAYNGDANGRISYRQGMGTVSITLDRLSIARYAPLTEALGTIEVDGVLSGTITVESKGEGSNAVTAGADLQLESLEIRKILGETPIGPCAGKAKAKLTGGRLDLSDTNLDCGQIMIDASGNVILSDPIDNSILNLHFNAVAAPAASNDFKSLAQLIPNSLTGTIAKPRAAHDQKPAGGAKAPRK